MAKCVMKGIEDLKPYFKGGIPQYNVPPMEPFVVPEMVFTLGNNKHLKAVARNIASYGSTNCKLTNLKISDDRLTYKFTVDYPFISYEYDYDIDVNIASIPIRGFGKVKGNLTDIHADVKMIGKLEDREDGRHIVFNKFDVNVDVEKTHVVFTNLYKGDTILTEAMADLFNANSKQLQEYFKPLTNRLVAEELPKYANKVTDTFVFDELFPETI